MRNIYSLIASKALNQQLPKTILVKNGISGPVLTFPRTFGAASTFSLVSGSDSNLTIVTGTGVIRLVSAVLTGTIQNAVVRETYGSLSVDTAVRFIASPMAADWVQPPDTSWNLNALTTLRERWSAKAANQTPQNFVYNWLDTVSGKAATPTVNPPVYDPNGWSTGVPAVIMHDYEPLDTNANYNAPEASYMFVFQTTRDDYRSEILGSAQGGGLNIQYGNGIIAINSQYQYQIVGGNFTTTMNKTILSVRTKYVAYNNTNISVRLNGVEILSGVSGDLPSGAYTIGKNPQGGKYFEAKWATIGHCDTYISDEMMINWEKYEAKEWGLTI